MQAVQKIGTREDPASIVGRRVLAGLQKGRERAIALAQARATQRMMAIVILVNADRAAGRAARGVAWAWTKIVCD